MKLVAIALLLFSLTACASEVTTSTLPIAASDSEIRTIPLSVAPMASAQWGVGYYAESGVGDGNAANWQKDVCAVPADTANCPTFKPADRRASFSLSKSLHQNGFGSASAYHSGSIALGTMSFDQSGSDTVPMNEESFQVYNNADTLNWQDVLTPTSSTLKHGTPVQFTVTLTVSLSTLSIQCGDTSEAQSQFTFSEVGGDSNSFIDVNGACSGGTFVTTNSSGASSTTATGMLSGRIGEKTSVAGVGHVSTFIDCSDSCAQGKYSVGLVGSAAVTIASNSPGVSFKTASGATY